MTQSLIQRGTALCLSALVTLAVLGSVAEMFQRDEAPAGMALSQQQHGAQSQRA